MTAVTQIPEWEAAGLRREEYERVCALLGRRPNPTELRMFGVMWSEHCAYKHSRPYLKRLPAAGPGVLRGPGENAGVVEVAPGLAAALKVESHNHPSAVDPFHGAATGVGGILRDVLSMGARPVALLDSLRFGPPEDPQSRRLRDGVVAGISHYGNSVGVPVVGGEVLYEDCYRANPLVNVACVGLLPASRVLGSAAVGPGNPVVYAGARTGRDGIGGAAFASEQLEETSEESDRSAVQIGDPFAGKLLIEATLEALETGAVVALQDMGAAGITCAAAEMSARGGVGMVLHLDRVPRRERGMTPVEVLLSESQERMLLVVERGREGEVLRAYRRWGLHAEVVGQVTADPVLRVYDGSTLVVELPPVALTDAPTYRVPEEEPQARRALREVDLSGLPEPDPAQALLRLLQSPSVVSKRPIYTQYDHMVQLRTVLPPGGDAAVLRLLEAPPRGIALSVDGSGRISYLDPWAGGAAAVCEATLNVACVGAKPVAITDGLNLGNPERPEVAWELAGVVDGIAEACRVLQVPVVGGNVSLYNESERGAVYPTPVVVCLGVMEDVTRTVGTGFAAAGDVVALVGSDRVSLGGSEYLRVVHGKVAGTPVRPDLVLHRRLLDVLARAGEEGMLRSSHDISEGGLAVALAEACVAGGIGARCTLSPEFFGTRADLALFGEGPSRVLVSVPPERYEAFAELCARAGVPLRLLGYVGGDQLQLRLPDGEVIVPVAELRSAWEAYR
ncbi:MAG: phosphoribosylformylglycinamidine synthase subunit PurL [Armatimonadota bacterium]|nr:phosphoribosylformylglycinamidine synthase subunit PurL [Armatimonadota bacterium]